MQRSENAAFNDADLSYVRGALVASRAAQRASDLARTEASDPRVRALAHRARALQGLDIAAITSILVDWGEPHERATAVPASAVSEPDDVGSDVPFVETLAAYARATLASARMELVEGFSGPSRRLAEQRSRAQWRVLLALRTLAASPDVPVSLVR